MTITVLLLFSVYFIYFKNINNESEQSSIIDEPLTNNIVASNKYLNLEIHPIDQFQNHVRSYQGTQPDGAINVDENGQVIIDKDLKQLFDYFLSAIGELPLDQMRKYLHQFAAEKLTNDQLKQLLDYFDKYHQYLSSADKYFANMNGMSIEEKMQLLKDYRTDSLGLYMADAFFADEQDYIEFVLDDKQNDELLSQQSWLEAENQATKFQDVVIENREFSNSNEMNSTEIYDYRVEQYGQDAADRLTLLDQKRENWQNTVNEYFQQRQFIVNQVTDILLSDLHSGYSQQELKRLEALWRIEHE